MKSLREVVEKKRRKLTSEVLQ